MDSLSSLLSDALTAVVAVETAAKALADTAQRQGQAIMQREHSELALVNAGEMRAAADKAWHSSVQVVVGQMRMAKTAAAKSVQVARETCIAHDDVLAKATTRLSDANAQVTSTQAAAEKAAVVAREAAAVRDAIKHTGELAVAAGSGRADAESAYAIQKMTEAGVAATHAAEAATAHAGTCATEADAILALAASVTDEAAHARAAKDLADGQYSSARAAYESASAASEALTLYVSRM